MTICAHRGLRSFWGGRSSTEFFLVQKALTACKGGRPLKVAVTKNACIPQACTPKAPLRYIPFMLETTSAQRHQTCMYLLKYTTGSVQNHPQNRRMDCAYRFWPVTLSFCKGNKTLQHANWALDYKPRLSILPLAHIYISLVAYHKKVCIHCIYIYRYVIASWKTNQKRPEEPGGSLRPGSAGEVVEWAGTSDHRGYIGILFQNRS